MGRPQIILTSTNKTASFKVFVVCGWREEAVAGVCLRTYLVHSTFVFLVMYQGYESRKNCKPSCIAMQYILFFLNMKGLESMSILHQNFCNMHFARRNMHIGIESIAHHRGM